MKVTAILVASVVALFLPTALAGGFDEVTPFQDVVCAAGGLNLGCAGTGEACPETRDNVIDCSNAGGAKCRWYNAWEADVEVHADGDVPETGEGWAAEGDLACGTEADKSCTVGDSEPACGPLNDTGSGDVKCDVSVTVGVIPPGLSVTITCKDPLNPCIVLQATMTEGESFASGVPVQLPC